MWSKGELIVLYVCLSITLVGQLFILFVKLYQLLG